MVCLAWIFFRADSFSSALTFIAGFGRWDQSALVLTPLALVLILFGLGLHASPPRLIEAVAFRAARLPAVVYGLGAGVLILIVDAMRPDGVPAFIYFQF